MTETVSLATVGLRMVVSISLLLNSDTDGYGFDQHTDEELRGLQRKQPPRCSVSLAELVVVAAGRQR